MKKYECLYIVNINFDSEGTSAVVARVDEVLKNVGAEVVNTQHWGKRKLAYAINKERYGHYVLVHFQGENPDITELQREFEIEPGVLHYMTIHLDSFPDFDTLAVPQAYENERRRPGAPSGRRPSRYSENAPAERTAPAETAPIAEAATAEVVVEAAPKVETPEPAEATSTEESDEPAAAE